MSEVPFSPAEAQAARLRMGMTPDQVAEAMTRIGVPTLPRTVVAAEEGVHRPGESYLFALASVLWCAVADLMGAQPRTLREFRLARQLNADQVAARIGMDPGQYARAEYEEFWTGDSGQTRELSDVLGVPLPYLIEVIGQDTELVERLRTAVLGRWKPHVRSLSRATGAAEPVVADALRTLCEEYAAFEERYMGHLVARNGDARLRETARERAAWLRALPSRFRDLLAADGAGFPRG
ncbi:helix-turn-helix transcriptional regulator [Streptomyces sp. NPDC028635]|uniref:helix-turn-helix transcriptional regulator n=1 Tax=Streptomyces sp. NPDC028635 TaxID=3154800 RepID=UPI0034028393